jgi:hypothetical protein
VQSVHAKKPDLFGTQITSAVDEDAIAAASRSRSAAKQVTAARDESSVLFSLSALTSAAASMSNSSNSGADGDDSGLIDLRALADKDTSAQQASFGAPVGGILDASPLLGAPIMDPTLAQLKAPEPAPAKSNAPLIAGIAIGALGIVAAAVAVIVVLTREPPPAPQQPVATVTVTVTQMVQVPAPTDTASSAVAAPATGAPSATAAPTRVPGPLPKKTSTAATGDSPPPAAAPATTKAPPANKCGCAPADLACQMACSVK